MHKDGRSEIGQVVALDIIFFSCCFWRVVLHTLVFLIFSSAWFSFRFSLESPFTMFIFAFYFPFIFLFFYRLGIARIWQTIKPEGWKMEEEERSQERKHNNFKPPKW